MSLIRFRLGKLFPIVALVTLSAVAGCAASTVLQSQPPGARVFLNGVPVGVTPYTMTDTNMSGSTVQVRLEYPGFDPFNTMIARSEELESAGAHRRHLPAGPVSLDPQVPAGPLLPVAAVRWRTAPGQWLGTAAATRLPAARAGPGWLPAAAAGLPATGPAGLPARAAGLPAAPVSVGAVSAVALVVCQGSRTKMQGKTRPTAVVGARADGEAEA